MTLNHRVISIGTLDKNPFWPREDEPRTGHTTTTLVRSGDAVVLVDPGLPGVVLSARLKERSGLDPADITHVFLTSFHPDTRRSLELFDGAKWLVSEAEREAVGVPLARQLAAAVDESEIELAEMLKREVSLLQRCEAAPDRIATGIDLFPLPGVTPGMTGLLIGHKRYTLLITGDAIPTSEHLEHGQVLKRAVDVEAAKQSLQEAIDIADLFIPGRDGLLVNPMRGPF
jgi:glyoxylase-like metal-dependent hydrolase (beta-lactamase superfamily II)